MNMVEQVTDYVKNYDEEVGKAIELELGRQRRNLELIAGLIFNVVPQSFIQDYLGQPGFVSLLGITVIAALMYVCAVGHIPFIAALVASGAAPGVAITFLMAGAGTNIPELLTISRMIVRIITFGS